MDAQIPGSSDVAEDARFESVRAEPRDSMLLTATLRRANGDDVPIKVRNLSGGGLMAELSVNLLRDERVRSTCAASASFPAGSRGRRAAAPASPSIMPSITSSPANPWRAAPSPSSCGYRGTCGGRGCAEADLAKR